MDVKCSAFLLPVPILECKPVFMASGSGQDFPLFIDGQVSQLFDIRDRSGNGLVCLECHPVGGGIVPISGRRGDLFQIDRILGLCDLHFGFPIPVGGRHGRDQVPAGFLLIDPEHRSCQLCVGSRVHLDHLHPGKIHPMYGKADRIPALFLIIASDILVGVPGGYHQGFPDRPQAPPHFPGIPGTADTHGGGEIETGPAGDPDASAGLSFSAILVMERHVFRDS